MDKYLLRLDYYNIDDVIRVRLLKVRRYDYILLRKENSVECVV